ncbi:putative lipid-binding protein At4g00165 [Silene latifolia]|uniref:putative lipid-binding protein At4g00165 n=1 Tax=Silene latifolia TaxID=37657 RepID=UPI003D782D08
MDFRSSKTTALTVLLYIMCFTCTSSCNTTYSPPSRNVTISPPLSNVTHAPPSTKKANCETDIQSFGVCVMPSPQCCTLVNSMTEVQAAQCLCNALKASVFGLVKVKVNVPLIYLLSGCGQSLPQGFKC